MIFDELETKLNTAMPWLTFKVEDGPVDRFNVVCTTKAEWLPKDKKVVLVGMHLSYVETPEKFYEFFNDVIMSYAKQQVYVPMPLYAQVFPQ